MLEPKIIGLFRDETVPKRIKIEAASMTIGGLMALLGAFIYIFIDQAETSPSQASS